MAKRDELARAMDVSARRIEETSIVTAGKVAGNMRNIADNIRNFSVDKYKERMMDTADDIKVEVDKNIDNVKSNIRDHPLESVAIAAGTGLLIGAAITLMGRRAVKRQTRM